MINQCIEKKVSHSHTHLRADCSTAEGSSSSVHATAFASRCDDRGARPLTVSDTGRDCMNTTGSDRAVEQWMNADSASMLGSRPCCDATVGQMEETVC